MSVEVKVPQLPESVADATLVAWHKSPGDRVERDENLVDLETDKVVLEVPAPVAGVIKEIKIEGGATVTSGELLAVLEESVEAAEAAPEETVVQAAAEPVAQAVPGPAAAEPRVAVGAGQKLSPSARHMVEKHELDPQEIPGTGKGGRITKADVVSHLHDRRAPAEQPAPATPIALVPTGARKERRVPMTRLRTRIAERMVQSQQTAALLTSFNEVDLTEVMNLRKRYRDRFEHEHGVKLGFMSFFVKASIEALKKFPVVNASVDGNDVLYHEYYDIGIAVSTDRGLIVPVIRDADRKSFAEIELEISGFATRAREGAITIDELTGGSFTITNGGVFGSLMSTPIVNPPQSAILGMHKIQQRPMVVDGEVLARPMMYIAVTYDHRIIDGREAVLFLVSIKESLEDPARLLLQV